LASFGGNYLIVAFVLKDEVIAPVAGVEADMDLVAEELSIILAAVFLVVAIVMVGVIYLSTRAIVRPIERLSKASQRIASNIGKGNLLEDVELKEFDREDGLGNETAALNAVAGKMLHQIRDEQAAAAHADEMQNPYYHNQQNAWLMNVQESQAYPTMFQGGFQPIYAEPVDANAPPQYETASAPPKYAPGEYKQPAKI
jgi:methyl-accepting chemotaxis protein